MKCKPRKYSDGGKVMEREYGGNPSFTKSIAAKVGIGDGYSYSPKKSAAAPKPKDENADKRLTISNAPDKFAEAMAKRKAALNP